MGETRDIKIFDPDQKPGHLIREPRGNYIYKASNETGWDLRREAGEWKGICYTFRGELWAECEQMNCILRRDTRRELIEAIESGAVK